MANNIIKNFLGYLKLDDDEGFENDYDDYEEESSALRERSHQERERAGMERENSEYGERRTGKSSARRNEDLGSADSKKERSQRMERTSSSKVVPIRTTPRGMEVCIMKPSSFEDSQDICDMLLSGRAVVVNLEGFDPLEAQRIMDFISGSVYAINGKLHQISKYIFIFSPDSIDISGDYLGLTPEDGFEVPTLNREF